MRALRTVAIVGVLALSALLPAGLGAAPDSASARANFVGCGSYAFPGGSITAKVKSRGMKCRGAKNLLGKWQRKLIATCQHDPCERIRVEKFDCRSEEVAFSIRLRCEHETRDRAMKARWGE
jgi:hypothetical protein